MDPHHLPSEHWLGLLSGVTGTPKCNGKYRTAWRVQSRMEGCWPKNGQRAGKESTLMKEQRPYKDRDPDPLPRTQSSNSRVMLWLYFKNTFMQVLRSSRLPSPQEVVDTLLP